MTKVLYVEQHDNLGGGQRSALSLLTNPIVSAEWDVLYCLPRPGRLSALLNQEGLNWLEYPSGTIADGRKRFTDCIIYLWNFVRQVRWFNYIIRKNNIAIVYTSSPRLILQLLLATRRTKGIIIFHFHCTYKGFSSRMFLKAALNSSRVRSVLCPSQTGIEWTQALIGSNNKVRLLENWLTIETPILLNTHDGVKEFMLPTSVNGSFKFGVVGRVAPHKGQDLFLDAGSRLLVAGKNVELFVVGSEVFSERAGFALGLRKTYGQQAGIHFVESISAIGSIYSQLSCLVVPSRAEIFGQVVIEAMYFGLPVIVSNTGELPRLVGYGQCGLVFNSGSAVELREAMSIIMKDANLRKRLIEAGRNKVTAQYLPIRRSELLRELIAHVPN